MQPGPGFLYLGVPLRGGPSGPAAAALLLHDRFDGAAAAKLADHTPDVDAVGGGWLFDGADTYYTLDGAGSVVGTSNRNIRIDVGAGDVDIELDGVNLGTDFSRWEMAFRFQDTSNHWYALLTGAANAIQIREVVAGVNTTRAAAGITVNGSVDHFVKATADGADITAGAAVGSGPATATASYGSASTFLSETELRFKCGNNADKVAEIRVA